MSDTTPGPIPEDLEKLLTDWIEAAYAELLKTAPLTLALEALPEELGAAIQAIITANNLEELLEQIAQYPILLTPRAADAIEQLMDDLRQADQDNIVSGIEERYKILKQVE